VRERFEWTPRESAPERSAVLALQGLPTEREARPRVAALLDAAFDEYFQIAEPRAIVEEIGHQAFARVYRGEGRNAAETPLESIYPRSEGLALFVATVGEPVSVRIRELFAGNEPALASMLDSVASAAADQMAERLGARYLRVAGVGPVDRLRVLAYSPGYCGWHVSGQRELFAALRPGEIGVALNASFLMQPLKSVSGVLVVGPARIHRFSPDFPFCAECAEKPCRTRIAAVLQEES
jgi:hypothetical protein